MTPEQTAMRAKAEQQFTEKFERLGDPTPRESAEKAVQWLIREGWRPWPALVDSPTPRPTPRSEPSEAQRQAMAKIRADLDRVRGQR